MEELDNNLYDSLDSLTDDKLWDILDKISDGNTVEDILISNNLDDKHKDIITNTDKCTSCNSTNILFETTKSYYVCKDCGMIIQEILDKGPEWCNYDDGYNQVNSRCGNATNQFLPESSMGTIIGGKGYSRLRILQSWNQMPYKERSLSEVLQHIDGKLKVYKISKSIIDNAKILYKNISTIKHNNGANKGKNIIIRGLNRRGLIAACAFYGAKLQGIPRSPKEIADIFDLKLPQVTKGCRKFEELMNYQVNYNIRTSEPKDFIERFSYKLNIKKTYIELAIKIAKNITKLDIASDHQPTSIAAGSILLMAELNNVSISKKMISELFQISEVTITKTYKKIQFYQNIVINDILTDKIINKITEKIKEDPSILDHIPDKPNDSKIFINNSSSSTDTFNSSIKKKRGRPARSKEIINPIEIIKIASNKFSNLSMSV